MSGPTYYAPAGGLPAQTELMTGRAVFTEAYAVIPRGVYSDIVASLFPNWHFSRCSSNCLLPESFRRLVCF